MEGKEVAEFSSYKTLTPAVTAMADYMWEKQAQRCIEVEEEEL